MNWVGNFLTVQKPAPDPGALPNLLAAMPAEQLPRLSVSSKWCLLRANKSYQFVIKQTRSMQNITEMSNSPDDFSSINIVRLMENKLLWLLER